MTVPNKDLLGGSNKQIVLAGQAWPAPALSLRQQRELYRPLQRVMAKADGTLKLVSLTGDDFDDMATVCRIALMRAHPTLSEEEFDDLQTTPEELLAGVSVVISLMYPPPAEPEAVAAE